MAIDLFHNVHKGIRHALFDAAFALGRGDDDARERLATRFISLSTTGRTKTCSWSHSLSPGCRR
jgi:hypothetical protein